MLLARWLQEEHVSRWWGEPAKRLEQFDETPEENHRLIMEYDVPVGYVRWEKVDAEALAAVGLAFIPPDAVDMDLFIADPAKSGRGIGPEALRLVFEHLNRETDASLVGLCTSVRNIRAHKAFEIAGCTRLTQFDDPTYGSCYVYASALNAEVA